MQRLWRSLRSRSAFVVIIITTTTATIITIIELMQVFVFGVVYRSKVRESIHSLFAKSLS